MKYATREILVLSPLPCWKHLSEEVRRQLVVEMIADVEAEAALRRQRSGSQVLGASGFALDFDAEDHEAFYWLVTLPSLGTLSGPPQCQWIRGGGEAAGVKRPRPGIFS
jgi:hypothetical protein